ncbi:SusD/RagB family nutrient-binding outer membrane lipoprotein [Lunatibacter salilacus]|uniref:SusD/RagB family nutrient-binding outer membrane lipoprotein n=1 Tax=Lunatibacter salilacus TaxID=2483804 RepID=UPI00131DB146|nr:SusD/RagB family nutrient-binding outer membrane lipoprotein [Lunatibacter salilacus]
MKNTPILFALLVFLSGIWGCDHGFEELNKDPNAVTAERFNPAFLFTTAQLRTARGDEANSLFYATCFVQQMASLSNVGIFDYHGDKYVYHKGNNELLWNATYGNAGESRPAKLIEDILELTREKPEYHNLHQMARIWRTVIYHRLTDMYGEIPYFESSKGYYQQIYKPRYDDQREIYYDMLSELEDAVNKLDPNQPNFGTADIAYDGNIEQWRKFGNSMMLRLGLRLSKVEPSTSETWVKKAFDRGVFTSIDENLYISGTDATGTMAELANGMSWIISVSTRSPGKISATYFDFLKSHNDPRLPHTVAVYTDPTDVRTKNTDPALQKGLPNGLDRGTLESHPSYDPNSPGQEHQYSGVNREVLAKLDGPRMFITYAEVQFMLAEAAARGWISGNAETYYESGVFAAMKMLSQFDESALISDQQIADYLEQNPFVGTSNIELALEQINTQYWAATFLNGYEAYANLRRSGYPQLEPISYPDNETGGLFPGRIRYPDDEAVLNAENYSEAVARQGTDNFITKVWWDQ